MFLELQQFSFFSRLQECILLFQTIKSKDIISDPNFNPLSTKTVYLLSMIIHASHQRRKYMSAKWQSGNHALIKNLHFKQHGRTYTFIIQVPWAPDQNLQYIIHIITRQKTSNNCQVTKCSCNMRYLNIVAKNGKFVWKHRSYFRYFGLNLKFWG